MGEGEREEKRESIWKREERSRALSDEHSFVTTSREMCGSERVSPTDGGGAAVKPRQSVTGLRL